MPGGGDYLTSTPENPVVIGMRSQGGVSINTRSFFKAFDRSGAATPDSQWVFESGVTDARTIAVYDTLATF